MSTNKQNYLILSNYIETKPKIKKNKGILTDMKIIIVDFIVDLFYQS